MTVGRTFVGPTFASGTVGDAAFAAESDELADSRRYAAPPGRRAATDGSVRPACSRRSRPGGSAGVGSQQDAPESAPRCLRWDPYLRASTTMHPVVCDVPARAADLPVEHIPPGLPARSPTCTPGLGICQCGRHRRSRRRSGNARICPVTPVSDRPSGRHPIVRARIVTSRCHAVRVRVWTMRQFTGPQDRPSSREKSCSQTGCGPAVSSHRKRAKNSRPAYSADPTDTKMIRFVFTCEEDRYTLLAFEWPRAEALETPRRALERPPAPHSSCQVVNDRPLPVNLPGTQVRQ